MARSSYPSVSLPEAIVRLKALYNSEGTNPADREVVAQAIGYTSRNGASDATIAAMSHYGLLDETGNTRQLRISRMGLDIILGEPGELDRAEAVREAAMRPELFTELAAQYKGDKVSKRNIENYLVKKGFVPAAASKGAKSYLDTIEFVSQESPQSISNFDPPQETIQEEIRPHSSGKPKNTSNVFDRPLDSADERSVWIPIDNDTDVQLVFKGQLTDDTIEGLIEYLNVMKKRFRRKPSETTPDEQSND